MATRNIVPRATGEGSLGTETKKWGNIYADNLHSSNPLPIANGGTGASTVAGARNALGLGNTTGALPIANGGTGATTASQARANLGLDSTTGLVPTGTIVAFSGNNIPSGYLGCNGAAVSRKTYADLFAVIGTTYGAGDGSTTFNLPNLNNNSFLEGSDTAGTVKSAGLPDATGRTGEFRFKTTNAPINKGVFQTPDDSTVGTDKALAASRSDYSSRSTTIYFALSNANPIYGNSETVQPPALTMRYIIKY